MVKIQLSVDRPLLNPFWSSNERVLLPFLPFQPILLCI
jgi:hypothetical protein